MRNRVQWFLSLAIVLHSLWGFAAVPEWQIDLKNSSIKFTATQNGSPAVGEFKVFTGELFVDPENYKASNVHIVVDMNSLSASYGELVTTLTTPDWFNVKVFPKAEFKSTDFNKTGDKSYEAKGTLTIKDKSSPVTLTFTAEEPTKDSAWVQGTMVVKRSVFGVGLGEWSSTEEIKDEVTVDFKIAAHIKK